MLRENKLGYKILTDDGWKKFQGIREIPSTSVIIITFNDKSQITCTSDHLLFYTKNKFKTAEKFKINQKVYSVNGYKIIKNIKKIAEQQNVYDVIEVGNENKFFANDVLVHNCEFVGRSGTLIESGVLRGLIDKTKNATYEFVIDNNVRFFKQLDMTKKYLVSLDPSIGVENDFSAIQVFELPGFIQVAEWKDDKLNQNAQVEKLKTIIEWMYKKLKDIGSRSPEIYWSFENNTCGEGIIVALREKAQEKGYEYPQDYIKRATLISQIGNKRIGFTTDKRTKNLACSQLKILIESNKMDIRSKLLVLELTNFTANKASYAASKPDDHDDLVTSTLIMIMMYLQEKNKLDLFIPADVNNKPVSTDTKYDMPFLFTSN